uniref:Uncharacterized protein n=1 Tax=Arundo donax TaxID=35708 RepID=A0A0A8Z7T4_ARUDO
MSSLASHQNGITIGSAPTLINMTPFSIVTVICLFVLS